VTFEEVEEPPSEEVDVAADAAEPDDYEPVTTPEDGRPEVEGTAEARPARRDQWPPVVVPEDGREREWKWEFKHKGTTKKSSWREPSTPEESAALEAEAQAERDREVGKGK
jgi:hypothetical protein